MKIGFGVDPLRCFIKMFAWTVLNYEYYYHWKRDDPCKLSNWTTQSVPHKLLLGAG